MAGNALKTMAKKRVKAGTSKVSAAQRRALFVEAYIANGGNATQAAITAGYSRKTARQQGARLLTDVDISTYVEKRRAAVLAAAEEKTGLTVSGVLKELRRIVHSDPRRLMNGENNLKNIADLDDDDAAAVASIEITEDFSGRGEARELSGYTKKVKLWDKNSAIEKAMKHLGLFERDNEQKPAPLVHLPGVKSVKFEPLRGRGKAVQR